MIEKIYIPTLGRADNQITYNNLPQKLKDITTLVIQKHEVGLYDYPCDYHVVDDHIGIAKTRELIYRLAGNSRYLVIDDDMFFKRRNAKYWGKSSNMEKSKRNFIESDWDDMLINFNKQHDKGITICGCRQVGLPPTGKQYMKTGGIYSIYSIEGDYLMNIIDNINFSLNSAMEDVYFNMSVLNNGHTMIKFDEFVFDSKIDTKGGIGGDRKVLEGITSIKNKFPNYITISKDDPLKYRINWQKIMKESQSNYLSLNYE